MLVLDVHKTGESMFRLLEAYSRTGPAAFELLCGAAMRHANQSQYISA